MTGIIVCEAVYRRNGLGSTQYFSLVLRYGHADKGKRNWIQYRHLPAEERRRYVQDPNLPPSVSPDTKLLDE